MDYKFLHINRMTMIIIYYLLIPINLSVAQSLNVEEAAIELINNFEKLISVNSTDTEILENNRVNTLKNIHDIFEKIQSYDSYDRENNYLIEDTFQEALVNLSLFSEWKKNGDFFESLNDIESRFNSQVKDFLIMYKEFSTRMINYFNDNSAHFDHSYSNSLNFIVRHSTDINDSNKPCAHNIYDMQINFWKLMKNHDINCGKKSIYNGLYDLYNDILIGVYKGYTISFVDYELRKLKQFQDFSWIQRNLLDDFKNTVIKLIETGHYYLDSMNKTDNRMYKNCDPREWSEDRNYIRIKNHVSYYEPSTKWYYDQDAFYLRNPKPEFECNGTKIYYASGDLSIGIVYSFYCPFVFLDNDDYNNDRSCQLYSPSDFMRYKNKHWSSACISGDHSVLGKLCSCDKQSDSDTSIRTISLKEYYTNSSDNRVVTGIRFAVEKNIITIQIQDGQLIDGIIDPNSVRWRTDDDYPSDEQDPKTVRLDYKIRGFNLDDIELPEGQFVTGVKFVLTKNDRISLAVRGSIMYDNRIGNFSPPVEDQWHYPSEINSTRRSNIDVNYPKNPTDLKVLTTEISKSGQHYINLSISTFSSSNHNTAVVPLLDSRAVETYPPSGIGGLGLFYTGHSGYGGFLAFKYFSSQYKRFSRLPIRSIISNMKTPAIYL
ncbi:uncharacterized protein LOC130678216 [Microplitis mediator]|uniref:uncharacterized protein LOC130678216 n=1 Tax=Microplitis mediator TaxID=375433 RepID=UPI0025554CBE|nr:uncharacterized protein LOC130678216 [Microplitis mediator]